MMITTSTNSTAVDMHGIDGDGGLQHVVCPGLDVDRRTRRRCRAKAGGTTNAASANSEATASLRPHRIAGHPVQVHP